MTRNGMLNLSDRWFRFLQHLYPRDFRDEMGNAVVEAYMDRARDALKNGGKILLMALWLRALVDSLRTAPPSGYARRPHGGVPATGAAMSSSSDGG